MSPRKLVPKNEARLVFCVECKAGKWLAGALPQAQDSTYVCPACSPAEAVCRALDEWRREFDRVWNVPAPIREAHDAWRQSRSAQARP